MVALNDHLQILEGMRKRKGMYIHPVSLETVEAFLTGFLCAAVSLLPDKTYPTEMISDVGNARGWEKCACGPLYHIQRSELSTEEMMNEMIDIYIEVLRRLQETR